jgi:hypothetical protein
MPFEDHPDRPGWKFGEEVPDTRGRPPDSPLAGMRCLFGAAPGDWEHRLYLVPEGTPVENLVEFFEAGSHWALRSGYDERDTTDLVGRTLSEVAAIVPGRVELAGPAALRFRFARRLRLEELEQIESVYHRVDELQAGLEIYVNGTSGDSILADIRESGVLQLWWD